MSQEEGSGQGEIAGQAEAGQPWQDTAPSAEGRWVLRCLENDGEDEEVSVVREGGVLMCEVEIGRMPVQALHDGLTAVRWRRAAGSRPG